MKRPWLLKAFLIAMAFVSSCAKQPQQSTSEAAVTQSAAGAPAGARKPLDELADLLIGRWRWEINLATDYPGVGKKGEKVAGYETCRSRADRTAIECEFVFGKATETWFFWWDASSNRIKSRGGSAILNRAVSWTGELPGRSFVPRHWSSAYVPSSPS